MRTNLKYILLLCFLFFCIQLVEGKSSYQYGLAFKSYEVEKEERTSLNLTPDGMFSFPEGFILEFDVSFKQILQTFGYVFRIIGENNEYIDFMLSRTRNSRVLEPQLATVYKSGQKLWSPTFEELGTDFDQWIKVKLLLEPEKGVLKLFINGKEFEQTEDYFKNLKDIRIVFGKNEILSYETNDVPTMFLRDVFIKNIDDTPIYYWKLSQHTSNGVFDELKGRFASCLSPKWILDSHAYWQKEVSFATDVHPQIIFNREEDQVAIADNKYFYLYSLKEQLLRKHVLRSGVPQGHKSNQMIYNSRDDKYVTYDFIGDIATYDTVAKTWNNTIVDFDNPHYWHHNRYYSPATNTLYTFNGYGFHLYKNDLHKYHFDSSTWEIGAYKGDTITPRYLSGLGALDEKTLLLFGGYGSEKGNQELSPRNYYELYTFDLETSLTQKKWELNPEKHNFVVVNSLVVDSSNNCFYALCFPHQKFNTTLQLYRFSIDEPSYEILADSIPYPFSDIYSYADLYLSSDESKLIAVTSYTDEKNSKGMVNIYTLSFPPLNSTDLYQNESDASSSWIYIIISAILLGLVLLMIWRRSKTEKQVKGIEQVEQMGTTSSPAESKLQESVQPDYDPILGIKPLHDKRNKQSILLFGGFQVIDKDSNNITGEFTPTLKQLFLLILLYTLKDGKGISSVKLREILWFDKTNESAKNNRGVSLSKLRTIFDKIGKISISSANSYWTVEFDEDIYCDYYEALILMNRLVKQPDHKDINRLISIVSGGELLPNLETEWIDTFKSDFSNRLIDLLLNLISRSSELNLSPSMMINIADAVFAHDSLNEDALKIKTTLLVEMGKNGLAQKTYMSFAKEYQSLFGVDFKLSFEQVIS
ncbi:hypothetical protein [Bacteroides sp. 51]|uniref:hypothetical protein n=1 Tax=Bacteroides sp. 51 TaxID=2302938 RepID=UPI0013D2BEBF|nr:hypothetical protein [Bacteroides sp. 51]NDV81766.1 hypothetical protein [Bacteroides sp. 51]